MTTRTQQYEIEAWLGEDHGLTAVQIADLVRISDDIHERYPDMDLDDERAAALTVAYRLMAEEPATVVDELAAELARTRRDESAALAGLRQAAIMCIGSHRGPDVDTQAGFARRAGVDRMAVRDWLGLRETK